MPSLSNALTSFEKISEALAIFGFNMSCTSNCISFRDVLFSALVFSDGSKGFPLGISFLIPESCSRTYFSLEENLSNFISSFFFIT